MYRSPEELSNLRILGSASLQEALVLLDDAGYGVVCVVDETDKLQGVLTNGDFRKFVLKGGKLSDTALDAANRHPVTARRDGSIAESLRQAFLDGRIRYVPIVADDGSLVDVAFLQDLDHEAEEEPPHPLPEDCSVVVMAGGKGSRLDPFTRILPKPLIPVGEKPIIEIIMERFKRHGAEQFWLSVNHKARMIRAYFEEAPDQWKVHFIEEDKPLGTIGALAGLGGTLTQPFIVTNCDILITADYGKIYQHHVEHRRDITIVTSAMQYTIPYGVCEVGSRGELIRLDEKPSLDLLVNTGMYVLSPAVLSRIPKDQFFDVTDLIRAVMEGGGEVGVYPVSQGSWLDVGQWEEYQETVRRLGSS